MTNGDEGLSFYFFDINDNLLFLFYEAVSVEWRIEDGEADAMSNCVSAYSIPPLPMLKPLGRCTT